MVRAYDGHYGIRKLDLFQNLSPDDGMDLHLLEFFGREFPRLRDDVFRNRELADVMQNRRSLQGFGFVFVQAKIFGEFHGVNAHPLKMLVGGVVFGFDGEHESFNGWQVKIRYLIGMSGFILELAQIKPGGPVHEVNRRQDEKRRLPSDMPVQEAHQARDSRAYEVVRERPEIALRPYFQNRLAFG